MADKIEYGVPSRRFYTEYNRFITEGKVYKVTNGHFYTDTGTRLRALFDRGTWLIKVSTKNIVGGKLL